jgi:hypothetical protein
MCLSFFSFLFASFSPLPLLTVSRESVVRGRGLLLRRLPVALHLEVEYEVQGEDDDCGKHELGSGVSW